MNNIEWNKQKWDQADAWATEYLGGYAWGGPELVDAWIARHVLPWLPAGRQIRALEIACGMGRFSERLLRHVSTLHAIDLAEVCVEGCRTRFAGRPEFTATLTDGRTLPDGEFDLIVSFDSLVHADAAVLDAYFRQFPSRLSPGGVAIINHANSFDAAASRMAVSHADVQRMISRAGGLDLVAQTLERWTTPLLMEADGQTREADAATFIDCVTVARRNAAPARLDRDKETTQTADTASGGSGPIVVNTTATPSSVVDRETLLARAKAVQAGGRAVVIWGAGAAGAQAATSLEQAAIIVDALIDRDPAKQGRMIHGAIVRPPSEVTSAPASTRPFVVIASAYAPEIEKELAEAGFAPGRDLLRFPVPPSAGIAPSATVRAVDAPPDRLAAAERQVKPRQGESSADAMGRLVHTLCRPSVPDRPHVAVVLHEASRTGAPLIGFELARWLRGAGGLDVSVLVGRGGALSAGLASDGVVIDAAAIERSGTAIDGIGTAVEWIAEARPAAVICNSAETWPFAAAFAARGIPILTLMHEFAAPYPPERLRALFDASGRVAFPADVMRRQAATHVGIDPGLLRVAPQGLLPSRRITMPRDRARRLLLAELNAPAESFIVLGCGVVGHRKGTDLVPQIAARVRSLASDAPIVFAWLGATGATADGPLRWITADLRQLGVADRVIFLGERPSPGFCFAGADTFLLPSREDPFPCVVHEAMDAGLPIVAFADSGGAPEALEGGAGIVVPYADLDATAAAIVRLAGDEPYRREIGSRARERVRAAYDFDGYGRRILDLLREMGVDVRAHAAA